MSEYDIEKIKRENTALRKYAAIQKATEERVCCQKIYVDITGGLHEALILDELIFFTLPRPETGKSGLRVRKEGVLWMAVSRTEWWDRKRLTAKEADGAIERLVKQNLVFKDYFLFNKQKTTHLRLNIEEFFKRYSEELDKQNPPEDENDTFSRDINDLYEMMGIPNGETGILKGNTGIPVGEEVSLNGDSINSPNTSLTQSLKDSLSEKLPIDWKVLAGVEISSQAVEEKKARDKAVEEFERTFGFGALPWSSNGAWTKFEKFIVTIFKADINVFKDYVAWREGDGKYMAYSNRKIRQNPQEFIDTGYPEFQARKMYSKPQSSGRKFERLNND